MPVESFKLFYSRFELLDTLDFGREADATRVAGILNRRPRKRFGYECPRDIFAAMCARSPYSVRRPTR
jgi:hypothetical protein